jgi:Peptidase family M28
MDRQQTRVVIVLMATVVLCWLASILFVQSKADSLPLIQSPARFDAVQALGFAREFVTRFPRRVLGSIEARQSTGYLKQQFESLGYNVGYTHYDAIIASRRQVGRNVLAIKEGRSQEILAAIAHYDTAPTTRQGAMDNGSSIGVLLELARVFSTEIPRRSLLLVASDGAEWGLLGALDIALNYSERGRIVAAISLDYVAVGEIAELRLDTVGQTGGYAPPWLRDLARRAAEPSGLAVREPSGFREHLERALLISWNDQGPFLRVGTPAINLGSGSQDRLRERAVYHSENDLIENMSLASIRTFGQTAERILRTMDALSSVAQESMEWFRVRSDRYLAPSWIAGLQYATFAPFLAMLCFYSVNHWKYLNLARVAREGLALFAATLPFALAYFSIALFRTLRLIPRYTFYPAPVKDPVLQNPAWGVVSGILGVAIISAVIFHFAGKHLTRNLGRPDFFVSKLFLMTVLFAVIVAGLWYNRYWTVTFLALPAWIWGLTGLGKGSGGRVGNRIWIVASGMVFYILVIWCAVRLGLGWRVAWYAILASSIGMFTATGVLLAVAAVGLGLRLVAIQSHSRID